MGTSKNSLLLWEKVGMRGLKASINDTHPSPLPEHRHLHKYLPLIPEGSTQLFDVIKTTSWKSNGLPLLLERVGVRRIKSTVYIHLIPTFSPKGEGVNTCVDTYALIPRGIRSFLNF
jgi:hypothetical protein